MPMGGPDDCDSFFCTARTRAGGGAQSLHIKDLRQGKARGAAPARQAVAPSYDNLSRRLLGTLRPRLPHAGGVPTIQRRRSRPALNPQQAPP
jgi:hypothetical protein